MNKIVLILMLFFTNHLFSQITITSLGVYGGCVGSCQGNAKFSCTGGLAPYSYSLSPSALIYGDSTEVLLNGLCAGSHTLTVTDQNSQVITYTFSTVQSSGLTAIVNTTNTSCTQCNGVINISGTGGIPPYVYLNGDTPAAPYPVNMPMDSACSGFYNLFISDNNGCMKAANVMVDINNTLSGVNVISTSIDATCSNSYNGAINLNISGTNPGPFTFLWSTMAVSQNLSQVSPGIYSVKISDSNMDCMTLTDTIGSVNGFCGGLSGNVFFDNNTDCVKNSGDYDCPSAIVNVMPGNRYGYTNPQGNYYVDNLPLGSYTVTIVNSGINFSATCSNTTQVSINSGNYYPIANKLPIGQTSTLLPDVQVSAYSSGIVPGFNCNVNYVICNLNNVLADGVFKAILPSGFVQNIVSVTPNIYSISGDTVIWNYSNLSNINGCQNFIVSFNTPISTSLGSIFTTCMVAIVTSVDNDYANNNFCYDRIVTGAFDPNDKSVSPLGQGINGNIIVNDSLLTYLIRFQNTGNGPANTVIIQDSISSFLNISSFQMLSSSHNYFVEITPGNIIKWTFNNIMLPDSNTNEPGSHGYIRYSIKQKQNNPLGSRIKNTAFIYFDYNNPIITNTTLNTITSPISFLDEKNDVIENQIQFFPNPSNGVFHLINNSNLKLYNEKIEILNLVGETVYTCIGLRNNQIDLRNFSSGSYLIRIVTENNSFVKRLMIVK